MTSQLSARNKKLVRLILLVLGGFVIFYFFLSRHVLIWVKEGRIIEENFYSSNNSSTPPVTKVTSSPTTPSPVDTRGKKIVLFYTSWYGNPKWIFEGNLDGAFYTLDVNGFVCPKECLYTHDKSYLESADLVFASLVDLTRKQKIDIPATRSVDQVWAGFVCESPINVNVNPLLRVNNNRFNWTATYRLDSDVYWPSGHFHPRKTPLPPSEITPTLDDVKKKTKLAAWIVSNCGTKSKREGLVKQLQEKLGIDVFGKCGRNKCPPKGNCRESIGKEYKFYLSFENSLCLDYATEKFFEAFAYDMIPITYGLADYSKIAPPNSYINLIDFKNLDEFVAYIKFLDQHPIEYLKYFQWKRDYVVITNPTSAGLCNACVKLHETEGKTQVVEDFQKWWTNVPENATTSLRNVTTPLNSVCILPQELGLN